MKTAFDYVRATTNRHGTPILVYDRRYKGVRYRPRIKHPKRSPEFKREVLQLHSQIEAGVAPSARLRAKRVRLLERKARELQTEADRLRERD